MEQKKKLGRKILRALFTLTVLIGLMHGMSLTAYAEDAPTLGNSDLSSTGWSWDADTNKLTISGVNWSGTLVMPAGSTLVLADGTRNTITGSGTTEVYYGSSRIGNIYTGLYGKGALTISGSGELYVYSDSEKETSRSERQRGICVNGNLTIKDDVGTVYAEAENSSFASGNASNYCDIYSATVGISVHGNYIQHGGNVECVAGKGGYQSIGIAVGRGAAGITVDGANAVLTGRGGYASNHSFGMCCGSEFDDTQCSINIQKGKVNLYAADCGRYSYGLFGGNGCILNVSGGEITAIGKKPANGSRGLRSRGGINISGGVLYVEGLTSALYAGGGGISGNISITDGMLVAKTGSETAVQVDNGKITLDTGLTTDNVKSGFTSGSSSKIDVDDKSKPVRIGNLRYYVQFDVQNHGVSPETQYFSMGGNQKVSKPEDPVAAGYEFGGWFEEAGCTTEWDFENEVTNDKTLYAKWTEIPATAPTISAQPEDLSMTYGYTGGSICVEAMAAKDTTYTDLTYQWYSNTTSSNEDGTAITENGASATYTIPTGKPAGTTEYYYCVVTATRNDNNLTATVTSSVATVTVTAADPTTPTGLTATYGQTLADVTLPDGWVWADSTTSVGDVGTNTFKANYTSTSTNYSSKTNVDVNVVVGKADSEVTTAPTAKTLTYSGSAQELVTAGTASGGKMQYALGTQTEASETYTTSIPTATDAGTYYVWYKVVGDENHNNVDAAVVEVEVNKANWIKKQVFESAPAGQEGSVDLNDYIATGGQLGAVEVKSGSLSSQYPSMEGNTLKFKFDELVQGPETIADITIRVTGASNYTDYSITATVSAPAKKHQTLTFDSDNVSKQYGDKKFTIVPTQGATDGYGAPYGEISYTSDNTEVAEVSDSGEVTIKKSGYAVITANAKRTAYEAVTKPGYLPATASYILTVNKADIVNIEAPTARNLKYTGSAQKLINAGKASGGVMQYALGTDATTVPVAGWNPEIPEATEAGPYYVWYKVIGDENHENTAPVCIEEVKISKKDAPEADSLQDNQKPKGKEGLKYTEDDQPLVTEPKTLPDGYKKVQYSTDGINWSDDIPTGKDANDYTVKVKYVGDENHEDFVVEEAIHVTIDQADAPEAASLDDNQKPKGQEGLTYKGSKQPLVTAPKELPAGYDKVQYSIDGGETWSDEIPTGTDAGDYTVKARYSDSKGNHESFYADNIKVTISREAQDQIDKASFTVKNASDATAKDGEISGVDDTMEYSTDGGTTWNEVKASPITGLSAGDVLVRYKETANREAGEAVTINIKNQLEEDKTAAKKELDDLLSDENKGKYDEEGWKAVEEAVEAGKKAIDEAKDEAGVNTAKEEAITKVEAVKTKADKALEAVKEAAKKELDDLLSDENRGKYDEEGWKAVEEAVEAGKKAIDEAKDEAGINTAKEEAIAKAKEVKTIAEKAAEKDAADKAVADKVIEAINKLPASDKVATTDKAAIEAARKAYTDLTADQKKKVPADTLKKLEDAEKALEAAEKKEAADTDATKKVTDAINALPASDKVAVTDKAAIEAARKAYDALTDDQKAKVSADTLKHLTDAEAALATVEKTEKLAADKAAFEAEKTTQKAEAEKLVKSDDSEACKKLAEDAGKAIDALTYDENKTLEENKAVIAATVTKLASDLEEQRKTEALAADEAANKNTLAMNAGFKVTQKGSKITVKWGKVEGADGYEVYVAYCGKQFSKTPAKRTTTKTSAVVTKINGKKIDLKRNFKVYVKAVKKDGTKTEKLASTITGHIVGRKNSAYTNVKSIKLTTKDISVEAGKTAKIKAKTVLVDKSKKQLSDAHAAEFRYASSNTKIATVDKSGKVTGVSAGTCTIYVYARNGYAKKVSVTVK